MEWIENKIVAWGIEFGTIRCLASEPAVTACPVCGVAFESDQWPVTGGECLGFSFDICPCCGCQYGLGYFEMVENGL